MEIAKVGLYCKTFRERELKLTLREVSESTKVNLKTLSAFEHGRSKNIAHLFKYLSVCNEDQRTKFVNELFEVVGDL